MTCCLRDFLTPAILRTVHAGVPHWDDQAKSWELTTLLWTSLLVYMQDGKDSLHQRFHRAAKTVGRIRCKQRAPGKTLSGFLQALKRLPYLVLVRFRVAVRDQIRKKVENFTRFGRWLVLAADGSRLILPRTAANEKSFGGDGEGDAPNLLITVIYDILQGIPYDWRIGSTRSGERKHVRQMLGGLPPDALLVADIGFGGYDQMDLMDLGSHCFLIRVGSTTQLLALGKFEKGIEGYRVWLWPRYRRDLAPLELRAIKLKPKGQQEEVWLLTNVLDTSALPGKQAAEIYEARWRIEVDVFRGVKQTLGKTKLCACTPLAAMKEAEWVLLGLLVLQGMSTVAQQSDKAAAGGIFPEASLRAVQSLVEEYAEKIRNGRKGWDFGQKLRRAIRDGYKRKGTRRARRPVKIKDVSPPKPPKVLKITPRLKAKGMRKLAEKMRQRQSQEHAVA